jgi:NAD(P)-dependent dehydrogenase (short-subunit alcohol dehydrogenase family)
MPTILISGANRGLGFELARQYAEDGWTVHGTARRLEDGDEFRTLGMRCSLHPLEVTEQSSVQRLAQSLQGEPIDVMIANSGVSGDLTLKPEAITLPEMLGVMAVNVYGPLALSTALLPNLLLGNRKIACAMSSLMSSISLNDWGTQFVYRSSKSALNQMWRSLAVEWKPQGVTCLLLRPGKVKTRMTGYTGDLTPQESVTGLKAVINAADLTYSGRLIGYDGLDVPW